MLKIAEIFYSIQGESSYTGFPCIFVRLAGCNLRCLYCDSKYSYEEKYTLSVEDVFQRIKQYLPTKLIEITGGEPLLQPEVYDLISLLISENYTVLLETNGSVLLDKVPSETVIIMDIKCPSSNEANSFERENLTYLKPETDEIKFVLADRRDYDFALQKIKDYHLDDFKILFSPITTSLAPAKLAEWMLRDHLDHRLQIQLHKVIWGADCSGV